MVFPRGKQFIHHISLHDRTSLTSLIHPVPCVKFRVQKTTAWKLQCRQQKQNGGGGKVGWYKCKGKVWGVV